MGKEYSNNYLLGTGVGLQEVDGLKNSSFFNEESNKYIEGEIGLDELEKLISSYYKSKPSLSDRCEEADKISIRIAKLLSNDSFSLSLKQILSIHSYLFSGINESAGAFRPFNISKKEWVLNGESLIYGDFHDLELALEYDLSKERKFDYSLLNQEEIIDHLSLFISSLWQIHAFNEGSTRTTAVFFIKYLRFLGYDVNNDAFAKSSWYFRNSLVRANYNNLPQGITEDRSFLKLFLRNLLLGEKNELRNRDLHVQERTRQENIKPISKQSKVLSLLSENPRFTSVQLANRLGVSSRTVKLLLSSLSKNGIIVREGGKKFGHWVVNDKLKSARRLTSAFIMKDNQKLRTVLKKIAICLNERSLSWALGGSLMLSFFDVNIKAHDIDLVTDVGSASEIESVLFSLGVKKPKRANGIYATSYFGEFIVDGVDIDLMSEVKVKEKEEVVSFLPSDIEKVINLDGVDIPLSSLKKWEDLYHLIDRKEKVELIEGIIKKDAKMKKYNKLVRDNIPEIIEADGKTCKTRILIDEEYQKYAFAKLLEEASEANEAQTIEELADLEEVVLAAAKSIGVTPDELEKARKAKAKKNGAFDKKILLEEVD